ncbi:MAG TPA: hypothetical protein DCR93_29380, partial [Cytophagales bacterium]|nr:hypothetical protein [Cytophagales bacterium]
MKRVITLALGVLMASIALAQPSGYYNSAEGKSGSTLKSALHGIIDGHNEISYSACWDALKVTDRDPNNSSNVIGLYSGFSMNAAAEYAGGAGWNREHVWAKSRGDFGTSMGAGTDLHHLRAEDVSTNSARNNRHFGSGNQFYTDGSGNYSGPTQSKTNTSSWVWEPRDAVKGDVARMMFYMAVRYEGGSGEPDLELNNTITGNTDKTPFHASLDLLLQWHEQDPVDQTERNRNDAIYSYQNNRNPFIDRPEFVDYIWGDGTPGGGGGGGGTGTNSVTITLVTDQYPTETAWTLKNSSGTTVASRSNYTAANTTHNNTYSLADGTYTFTITDSYGDGICCSYGNGSFTWKEGSTTLTSGGSFSSSQTKTFTVGSGSSGGGGGSSSADITVTIRTDNYPSETTWQIRNRSGQTVGGGGPYSTANSTFNKTYTLATGSYTFVINDEYGDGICCSYGNGSYTVKNGSTTLTSGGSFGSSESKGFTVA